MDKFSCTGNDAQETNIWLKSAENRIRSNLELLPVMNVKKLTQNRGVFYPIKHIPWD